MEKQTVELVHDSQMNCALNDIGWYARKYTLTPDQVRRIFEAGLAAGKALDAVQVPRREAT